MTTYAGHTAEALRALAEGATPGERYPRWGGEPGYITVEGQPIGEIYAAKTDARRNPDLDFICAANPATVLALLDEMARLRGALEGLKAATEEEMLASAAFYYHETIDNGTRANKAVGALIDALSAARAALEATDGH
jgi:hypothetical protein